MTQSEPLLEDIRVLELGHIVSGPSAGLILAELGADVIKVERPDGGDQARQRPLPDMFLTFNRNKRSVVIDLKTPRGKEIFREFVKTADIVLDNYAPRVMDKMGLGYENLCGVNPRLLYCSIKGFLPGPYGDRPLLDEPAQMMGGLAYMTGPPGQPLRAGTSVIDIGAGMFGIIGLLAALHKRQETGKGQRVQVGLFESTVFLVAQHMSTAGLTGQAPPPVPERLKGKNVGWAIYRIFNTKDQRQVFIGITGDAHWERFCREFDFADLWEDLSLRTNKGRVLKHALLNERVARMAGELTFAQIVERLEKIQVPHAPINTPMDLFQNKHLRGRNHLMPVTALNGVTVDLPALPMIFDSCQSSVRRQPPRMGQHTREIMEELGYSPERIEELMREKVVL
jgi:crotonobetainyl-CoA:carnitine CoA-transferase CaiB-like acyl-CoA transferase